MIPFLIIAVLLLLLPDLYIWLSFVRPEASLFRDIAFWLPSALALAALAAFAAGHYHDWLMKLFFWVLLGIAVPKLIFYGLSVAGRAVGWFVPHAAQAGNLAGIVAAAIVSSAFVYGFVKGWKRLTVKEQTVAFEQLPTAFDGYRILQLSDLHLGTFGSDQRFVRELVSQANALHPDLIVFTGDLVNAAAAELTPHQAALSQLEARDGIFAVLGNHDYCEYNRYDTPDGASRNLETLKRGEKEMGWQLLLNEHRTIRRDRDSILLVGVENDSQPPFPSRGDLHKALEEAPHELFTILMSHDPTHWRREVLPITDIPLTLSGHTHAMQLRIGSFSPARWPYPEWGGLYCQNGRMLYVSQGAGGTVPFRFGAWPEINLITLKRKKP